MNCKHDDRRLQLCIAFVLCLNIVFWFLVRDFQARWMDVPPVPEKIYAASYGLGDTSFSYRLNGLMIQNLGDTGGRMTPLDQYNYERLAGWFFIEDYLDPRSNYIPQLAAFYFGGVQKPEKFKPVLDYLEHVGERDYGEKWRWLAHAVYLAKTKIKDKDRALELAYKLAKTTHPDVPSWARQMPAFVLDEMGEKESAYAVILQILKSNFDDLDPAEVTAMKDYVCLRLLDENEAKDNPLCQPLE